MDWTNQPFTELNSLSKECSFKSHPLITDPKILFDFSLKEIDSELERLYTLSLENLTETSKYYRVASKKAALNPLYYITTLILNAALNNTKFTNLQLNSIFFSLEKPSLISRLKNLPDSDLEIFYKEKLEKSKNAIRWFKLAVLAHQEIQERIDNIKGAE